MKYLNKIIFINSANISYAEVAVDGNVHFTGTQGVGKSTILRALLFFYNADKHKLGIQLGQKPFDEFYFRHANSYILYEVMRENGAYTILLSRYQGHTTWRFIDAPYNRNWIVGNNGQVLGDWIKIRERIDSNISVSARIESGAMFKDIIFGNSKDAKYAKYALVRSSHYQNIPRSIQNVFLNTKLDADFIKNTIIQSMADDDLPIDIKTYRRLTQNFEREYDEIGCWFNQSKDGTIAVKKTANKIAEEGRKIVAFDQHLLEIWRKLNHAVSESEKLLPLLEAESLDKSGQLEKEREHLRDIDTEFNKNRDALNQKLGGAKTKINEISTKRKYFATQDIERKLELANREIAIKNELNEKNTLLSSLLKEHASIEEKYNIAKGKLSIEIDKFKLSQEEVLNKKKTEFQRKKDQIQSECSKHKDSLYEKYRIWRQESDERLKSYTEDLHRADIALKDLNKWHPKETERMSILDALHQIDLLEKETCSCIKETEREIESIRRDYETKDNELKNETERKIDKLTKSGDEVKLKVSHINKILENLDGSFYDWLTQNANGWEENIGKIVDDERILYAHGLEPTLESGSNNLYGIRINLNNIELSHRTPDILKQEKKELEDMLSNLSNEILRITESSEAEHTKLSQKLTSTINPIKQQLTRLKLDAERTPITRQNRQNDLHSLDIEEQDIIKNERDIRQQTFNNALLKVQEETDSRKKQECALTKELKNIDAYTKKEVKSLEESIERFKSDLDKEAEERLKEFEKQTLILDEQMKMEISGRGIDASLFDKYNTCINQLKELLTKIESNRWIVTEYRVAESDLFSIEPQLRSEIKTIEFQINSLNQTYEDKKEKIIKKINNLDKTIRSIKKQIETKQQGLNEYHQIIENENFIPHTLLSDGTTITTSDDCRELISLLRGCINGKRNSIDTLKTEVTDFNKYFRPQNVFGFNTMPVTDNDYLQIAFNLQDFLDNNKIEEYRKRTSEHYKDIIGRISTEVSSLVSRRSEVDTVIQDINRDFIEKNFAGVIKSIELREIESSDKLMQLLISINRYTSENSFSIGEVNLFSNENRDEVNLKIVDYLKSLTKILLDSPSRDTVSLGDTFTLQFRVKENDNDTGWVEKINNVGSDGTDILVKAMVNIMLINVFKKKAAKKNGDFVVHCMMDEIGRLHPSNIKGMLQFANSRNIYLINSSPTSYNPYDYKYTYMLSKHDVKTRIDKIMQRTK